MEASDSRCPICEGTRVERLAPYRHSHPVFSGSSRVTCAACGMVFAAPMPEPAAWDDYNRRYFANAHGGPATGVIPSAFFSAMGTLRCAHVERYLQGAGLTVSSVMEIGPGGGHFARHWLDRHPATAYCAIESDTSCHAGLTAAGIRLIDTPAALEGTTVLDLVVLSHVLEHVATPLSFLRAAAASLRRGGALFIEVPCRDWEHKPQDEPHLLFFDKAPMARLLDALGFGDIRLTYHGTTIAELKTRGRASRLLGAARSRLLAAGLVGPFASPAPGLELLHIPLERAVVKPYQAHCEQDRAAWWLRALAIKR